METITLDEFFNLTSKLNIVYGQIIICERIPKSKKLLKLTVLFGENINDEKVIVTNIGDKIEPENLIGLVLPFILNFPTVEMMGVKSEGMIILPVKDGVPQIENVSIGSILFNN